MKLAHPGPTEFAGTSEMWARGDWLDLAGVLRPGLRPGPPRHLDGDTDHLGARKVKALTGLATGDLTDAVPPPDKIKVYVRVGVTTSTRTPWAPWRSSDRPP